MANHQVTVSSANLEIRPVSSFDEFAAHCTSLLDPCAGSDIVLFPELFTLELFTTEPGWQDAPVTELPKVDRYTKDYVDFFAAEAKSRNQFIAAGSHLQADGDKFYNVAHLFGPDGEHYQHKKTHIFPAEGNWFTSEGDEMHAIDLPMVKVGYNICYETEVPECASTLTEQGVELILCPSYTFTEYGYWRVRHTAQARAIENQIYFLHCATGARPGGPIPGGWTQSSLLSPCDLPWSTNGVIVQADTPNTEGTITGTIDLDVLRQNREDGAATTYKDRRRRADTYAKWASVASAESAGSTHQAIADPLREDHVPTAQGAECWSPRAVAGICAGAH